MIAHIFKKYYRPALNLGIVLYILPVYLSAQTSTPINCNSTTLTIHSDIYASVVQRLRYGTKNDLSWIIVDKQDKKEYGIGVPFTLRSITEEGNPDTMISASSTEEFHLLGWQWKSGVRQNGFINILLFGTFIDSTNSHKWALVEMCAFIKEDSSMGQWGTFRKSPQERDIPETNSLRIFDHKPTNADIYQFLDDWAPYDGGFFTSEDDPLIFLDGEICEETWMSVVGEPPTRFFPE